MTAHQVIKLTVMINLGASFTHVLFGSPYAAVGHMLLGTLGAICLGATDGKH
jgi:hypothetical protein